MSVVTIDSSEPRNRPTPRVTNAPSERSRVRRLAEHARYDRPAIDAILDAAIVGHLGIVDPSGQPVVLPVAIARRGDEVLMHGSVASRLFRAGASRAPMCLTVTHIDGLIVARSLFASSMRYRSVVVVGNGRRVEDTEAALVALSEHLVPGRADEVRRSSRSELARTMVVSLVLDEASAKVNDGWPDDPPEDVAGSAWAGVIPLRTVADPPAAAPDLRPGITVPPSVDAYLPPG